MRAWPPSGPRSPYPRARSALMWMSQPSNGHGAIEVKASATHAAIGIVYVAAVALFFRADPVAPETAVGSKVHQRNFRASVVELCRLPGFGTMTVVFSAMAVAN